MTAPKTPYSDASDIIEEKKKTEEKEIEKIMEEKKVDMEQAWIIYQRRKEEKYVDEQHAKTKKEEKTPQPIKKVLQGDKDKSTLENVYKTAKKWLGIRKIDTDRIDIILATTLSNQLPGTPIWLFIVGPSGDWKTTFAMTLNGLDNVIKIDQLTKNTLASGMKNAKDLGAELHDSSHVLLFLDLASITSANKEEKNIIWGQFRTLYDGNIYKRTGCDVKKEYENCHVTIIACTTESIRSEVLVHAQLGTRELMYDTDADPIDNHFKMDKAWDNENYEEDMKKELTESVTNFINWHPVKKDIEIPKEIKKFLKDEAQKLTILRAGGSVDRIYRELINPISPEVPTRLIKQLKRLYICLKSLDDHYPDKKAKQIISHLIISSGDKVRQMVIKFLANNSDKEFKISDVQQALKIGRNSVKTQLEQLWNLDVINKDVREERVGAYVVGSGEYEEMRGGHIENVSYYSYNTDNKRYRVTPHLKKSRTVEQYNVDNIDDTHTGGVNDG